MNLNGVLQKIAEEMGYPAAQDIYEGDSDRYITYTYEDERAAYTADDRWAEESIAMQVQMITPKDYNYFADKKRLFRLLERADFSVEYIQSFLADSLTGTDRIRQTVFSVYYTGKDKEE